MNRLVTNLLNFLPAEIAHSLAIKFLQIKPIKVKNIPNDDRLALNFCDIKLPHPVGLAAGFDKNAEIIKSLFSLGFSFIEVGAVTPYPQTGNRKPRIFRLKKDYAIINRLGFNNRGMHYVSRKIKAYKGNGKIGINVGANRNSSDRISDFVKVLTLNAQNVDFITVNVSSPNTVGLRDLQRFRDLNQLVLSIMQSEVMIAHKKPILIKVAPDLNNQELKSVVKVCKKYKISGIIATNTTIQRPHFKGSYEYKVGGLSGKPLFDISNSTLAKLYYLSEGKIPLIGVGGVFSGKDAYKKICLGASVVQLYTSLIYQGPDVVENIINQLRDILREEGHHSISEAVGSKNHEYLMSETDRSIFG